MSPKEFQKKYPSPVPAEKWDKETGEGYLLTRHQSLPFFMGAPDAPEQLIYLLPFDGPSQKIVTRTIPHSRGQEEVEFKDGPMYLVVHAPNNLRGFKYIRVHGDIGYWSNNNAAPF